MARRRRWASLRLCSLPKPTKMGGAFGYISGQRHLRFLLFSDKDPSSLTLRIAVGTPQQLDWTSYSDKLADPIYLMPPSSDNLKEPHKRVHFSVVLLQTARWMTAFLWWLQIRKSYQALWLTRPLAAILLMQRHQAPANARPPSSPKSTMSSLNRGTPPTCLASVLLPPLPSPPLTALKIRNTSACPLWMSPWPRISTCPRLLDGRLGQAIHQSHAEPLLNSLDTPTRRLDKQLCTLWPCSRCSRPRCSPVKRPVWMQLHSGRELPRLEAPLHAS